MISKRQRIIYHACADVVFIVHLALVLFVALGWLIPDFYYLFLAALVTIFLADIFLGYCPLTPMEFNIRKKLHPGKVYDTSCIAHYMRAMVGKEPRTESSSQKTFFKKHSFKFILIGLFIVSTLYHQFVVS